MKCMVCKIAGATGEMKKHPNPQTIFIVKHFLKKIKERNPRDLEKICVKCRNPLVFNTILTDAGKSINKVYTVGKTMVYVSNPMSKIQEAAEQIKKELQNND